MSETLDRSPKEGYGNECCNEGDCPACYRVEFDEPLLDAEGNPVVKTWSETVLDEDGNASEVERSEPVTRVVYHNAAAEMEDHLLTCQPYLDRQAAEAAAAEEGVANTPTPVQPMTVTPLVDESGSPVGISYVDPQTGKAVFKLWN